MKPIAYIESDFREKFGIPRQSGLADLPARIVFEPEYRDPQALRGLEDFSYLWLIWDFSGAHREKWSPTVRPPRLGGNARMGVFATRSPFRPNPIGLSSVRLLSVEQTEDTGPVIWVSGADLMDHTPILDIKPYLAYTDSHPDAGSGFAGAVRFSCLRVCFPLPLMEKIPPEKRKGLMAVLQNDPRPSYQHDPDRVYGFSFANFEIHFRVRGEELTVLSVEERTK